MEVRLRQPTGTIAVRFCALTIRCTMYAAGSRSAQDNRRAAGCADALRGDAVAAVDDDAVETAATEVTSAIVLEESFIPQW